VVWSEDIRKRLLPPQEGQWGRERIKEIPTCRKRGEDSLDSLRAVIDVVGRRVWVSGCLLSLIRAASKAAIPVQPRLLGPGG